jgi:hypothetical protein
MIVFIKTSMLNGALLVKRNYRMKWQNVGVKRKRKRGQRKSVTVWKMKRKEKIGISVDICLSHSIFIGIQKEKLWKTAL